MNIFKSLKRIKIGKIKKFDYLIPLLIGIVLVIGYCDSEDDGSPVSVQIKHLRGSELSFTVTNNEEGDVFLSSYDVPLKGHYKQYFKITDEAGEEIPYIGKYALIVESSDMWVPLKSGESIDFNVELNGEYEFPVMSGSYNIEFDSYVSVKNSNRNSGTPIENQEIFSVKSNELLSNIDVVFTAEPIRAAYPCNASQNVHINNARVKAKRMNREAYSHILNYKMDSKWQALFGSPNSSRLNFTTNGVKMIRRAVRDHTWDYNCRSDNIGAIAYVYKTRPYEVWLMPPFFNNTDVKSNGSVLIHEASHWNAVIGTNDYAYYNNCASLAKTNPDKAIMNADSYRQYIFNTSN